ncbi:MAG: NTP transferase domain-containing protein [Congregibacter sp.]
MHTETRSTDYPLPRAEIAVLLIAAGRGKRFGSDKRQASMDVGKTLLEQTLTCYRPFFPQVFVCVSDHPRDDLLATRLRESSARVVRCENAEQGMGSTISDAIGACKNFAGTLIALGDMPLISAQVLELLLRYASDRHIVYPSFNGRRGHPVIFGRAFYSDLERLTGDRGASHLIATKLASCREVAVEDSGVVLDVDTPRDLEGVKKALQARSSIGVSG